MDRRNFIKTVGLTAGATLLSGQGIAEATEIGTAPTFCSRRHGSVRHADVLLRFLRTAKNSHRAYELERNIK